MPARFYIVTGKGGVGKTIVSLALTRYLQQNHTQVCFTSMEAGSESELAEQLGLDAFFLEIKESAQLYMARKLNSDTIAKWIAKTPFFDSIFNMLPGFGDMIFLGHLIHKLQSNDDLTIVLDSPATGHALGLLESPQNFKDIFGSGPIVKDIEELHAFLTTPGNLETIIVGLPSPMSYQEGIELRDRLTEGQTGAASKFVLNEVLSLHEALIHPKEELPPYLEAKLKVEKNIIKELTQSSSVPITLLPYIPKNDPLEVIKELTSKMEGLV